MHIDVHELNSLLQCLNL